MLDRTATRGTFTQGADETPCAFDARMERLARTEYAHLDVHAIARRYGWLDGQFVCVADVQHAPVITSARRSRRGGRKLQQRRAAA